LWLALDRSATSFFIQLPPQGGVLRTELTDELLVLLNVILHRPHLILLHAAIAREEVAFGVALATRDREGHKRSSSEPRYSGAVQSLDVRAKMQNGALKRLRDWCSRREGCNRNSVFRKLENHRVRVKASVPVVRVRLPQALLATHDNWYVVAVLRGNRRTACQSVASSGKRVF
jgi:hypothetical protein